MQLLKVFFFYSKIKIIFGKPIWKTNLENQFGKPIWKTNSKKLN